MTAASAAPALAVETRNLVKAYDSFRALDHLDLTVRPGERVAVFGHNGAGKTTLIKILAGLFRPTTGSVRLWGRRPWGRGAPVRRLVGLISHQSYLYDELSARENLLFYARLYGVQDPPRAVEAALEATNIEFRSREPVRNLSRGMLQRVALARAILHDPALLLLDEPDTGLDPAAREGLNDLLAHRRSDLTVLMATHNIEMGMTLCSRWIVLREGQLFFDSGEEGGQSVRSEDDLRRLIADAG